MDVFRLFKGFTIDAQKGNKNGSQIGKRTEKTKCWKWELCTAMTCGRSKEETVEVVELGRTAIKSLEG